MIFFIRSKPEYKTIGILGGMGPEATAELYLRIIRLFQANGAKYDSDFPRIFIYNLPLPDVVENPKSKELIISMLKNGIKKLKDAGSDFIVIPCNTAFNYIDINEFDIPILSIINETKKEIKKYNYKRIGILGTETTIKNKSYNGIIPDKEDLKNITKIIMNILSGKKIDSDIEILKSIINKLKQKGAEAIVLGCTDLPLLISQKDVDIKLFDSLEILARATVRYAQKAALAINREKIENE